MTYNVFGGTFNLAQLNSTVIGFHRAVGPWEVSDDGMCSLAAA